MDVLPWICVLLLVFQRSDPNASRASLEVDNLLETIGTSSIQLLQKHVHTVLSKIRVLVFYLCIC